ncbi:uncharacterized protein LAJ45_09622 [Morchella importuna]|nr:uncharacterized protein LAJ45_09622 [Morchella importuna]KAH8146429.1 hypothetical protein LAJ45_09622 [Morchella importuna]
MMSTNDAEVASIIAKLKKRKRNDEDIDMKDAGAGLTAEEEKRKRKEEKREKRKQRRSDVGTETEEKAKEDAEQTPSKKGKKDKKSKKSKADTATEDVDNDNNDNTNTITTTITTVTTEEVPPPAANDEESKPEKKDKKHSKKEKKSKIASGEGEEDASGLSKHKSILQKLVKVKTKATLTPAAPEVEEEAIEAKGLEPLPQPAPTKDPKRLAVLASSLPPWLAAPIVVTPATTVPFNGMTGISPKLLTRLETLNLPNAFAVQSAVVPLLLDPKAGDVCISAATGSGKTLSYILPIVQSLSTRVVTRLRAVVVVPTRELVSQVFSTAVSLTSGTGLKVGTGIGSKALAAEQALLIDPDTGSKVDILITTPGRLVEHIKNTPGFCLKWVKWLVIDEADRLLAQSFQEWVDVVVGSIETAAKDQDWGNGLEDVLEDLGINVQAQQIAVRKVVLSATMTKDAGKLAGLKLRRPTMVVVEKPVGADGTAKDDENEDDEDMPEEVFSVPTELREYAIPIVNKEYKPLYLMYLLRNRSIKRGTIVFVKSNEGAARLAKLIDTVVEKIGISKEAGWTTGLVTGEMEKKRREKVLRSFKKDEVQILICSDLISRGLDLPHVDNVVNYDIPSSTRAYVHRVGRTARAGKEGDAFTLVEDKEARWFWRDLVKGIRRREEGVERMAVALEDEGMGWRGAYEECLYG